MGDVVRGGDGGAESGISGELRPGKEGRIFRTRAEYLPCSKETGAWPGHMRKRKGPE